ncbi:hypothetical protein OF83DRAFT_144726 [Amylostereum chailletii]|nr:hypothetical protein OF83DRAFT_144726 [Amylostereum chailletii]
MQDFCHAGSLMKNHPFTGGDSTEDESVLAPTRLPPPTRWHLPSPWLPLLLSLTSFSRGSSSFLSLSRPLLSEIHIHEHTEERRTRLGIATPVSSKPPLHVLFDGPQTAFDVGSEAYEELPVMGIPNSADDVAHFHIGRQGRTGTLAATAAWTRKRPLAHPVPPLVSNSRLLPLVTRSSGFRSPHTRNKPAELEERLGYFVLTKQDPEEPLPPFLPIWTASASSEMPGCVTPLLPLAHMPSA